MNSAHKKHWSEIKEQGTFLGLKATLGSLRVLGPKITTYFVAPAMIYYYCACTQARKASKKYLNQLSHYTGKKRFSSFSHFIAFGQSIVDKIMIWSMGIKKENIHVPNEDFLVKTLKEKKGGLFFTAHIGNIDAARIFAEQEPSVKINSLVFNQHSKKFNELLKKLNGQSALNVIQLDSVTLDLAVTLQEKAQQGEFFVIAADRSSTTNPSRAVKVPFLGDEIYLPEGPFILAGLLQCPAYFLFCVKEKDGMHRVYFEDFFKEIDISKKNRKENIVEAAQKYAAYLEKLCIAYPYAWFNFFDIFQPSLEKPIHDKKQ